MAPLKSQSLDKPGPNLLPSFQEDETARLIFKGDEVSLWEGGGGLTDKLEIWSILVNQKEHIHFYIRKNSHYFSLSHENQL